MTKSQLEEMLTQALAGLEEVKAIAIEADKKRLSAMNPIAQEYKALPQGEVNKVAMKKPFQKPERDAKAALSGVKLQEFLRFARTAVVGLKKIQADEGFQSAGVHSVYSGFNSLIKADFGLDCYQAAFILEDAGYGIKPVKGGVRIYLPEDAKGMQNNASSNRTAKLKALLGL